MLALAALCSSALVPGRWLAPPLPARPRVRRADEAQCCICINCKLVNRCKVYHWVEEQHEQPHVAEEPDFDPTDPQVQVFIRNEDADPATTPVSAGGKVLTTEYDVFACNAFVEDAGKWLRLMPDADYIPT